MDTSLKGLAEQVRAARDHNNGNISLAIEDVYRRLLKDSDHWDCWEDIGRWVLREIDYRTTSILGQHPIHTSGVKKHLSGKPWYKGKTVSWLEYEARIGAGFARRAFGDLQKRDLQAMANVRYRISATAGANAVMFEKAAGGVRNGKTLRQELSRLPEDVKRFLEREATGAEPEVEKIA